MIQQQRPGGSGLAGGDVDLLTTLRISANQITAFWEFLEFVQPMILQSEAELSRSVTRTCEHLYSRTFASVKKSICKLLFTFQQEVI